MRTFVETERLILREIVPEDDHSILEMDSDPDVHKYLGGKPLTTIAQAQQVIAYIRNQYRTNGIGRWAAVEKSTGKFIGWAGLKIVNDEVIHGHSDHYDLGYRLMKKYWGKGFATEAALAVVTYGFSKLHLSELFTFTDSRNRASQKILEKLNFTNLSAFDYEGQKHYWYHLPKSSFQHEIKTMQNG